MKTPFFDGSKPIYLDSRYPTRRIYPRLTHCGSVSLSLYILTSQDVIAGLAQALGALVPPYMRWSPTQQKKVYDYLWAAG